ncbi:MAG TPA: hypothetical protein VGJ93_00935 [Desulfuromonadaceae bacterium]|jgi:hypothetical protein
MFRKFIVILTMLFTLPAVASAWYVNSKTSTTGQGTITPAGNQIYATGVNSSEYTIAPAVGYKVSRVTLDGIAIATNVSAPFVTTVSYVPTKSWRYLVAYFTANTVNITTSITTLPNPPPNIFGGAIREVTNKSLTNIPVGSARQLLIIPTPGYTAAVTAAGATITDNPDGSKTAVFTNLQADQTVSATFSLVPVVTASAGIDVTVNGQGAAYAATLYGSATSNQGAITYAWTGTTGLSFGTPDAAKTTVYAATPGPYTATLTVTSGTMTATDTVKVTVLSRTSYLENQCTSCHGGTNPTVTSAYDASLHKASASPVVSCQACHDSGNTGHHGTNPLTACQNCHSAASEFYGSAHWQNHFEHGDEFAHQMDVTVTGATVTNLGTYTDGYLNANDSYSTTENGVLVTCAYRCHFRPGMGPDPTKRSTGGITITTGGTTYNRPTGDSCSACHDAHQPETANARNTCYTCHSGINHGWSVRAFEKSTHFTGAHAELYYKMKTKACVVCHNSHSTKATFGEGTATGCQTCHRPGSPYGIYSSNMTLKAPHGGGSFGTTTPAVTAVAQYMSQGATCADCHSHNNTINAQYAASAHGNTMGPAWTTSSGHDWPVASGGACNPCHTTKGFINKVNSGVAGYIPLTMVTGQPGQTLGCNACHSNTDKGTVQTVPQVVASYKFQTFSGGVWTPANATFPMLKKADGTTDTANSSKNNTCLICHSGRESGESIKALADADMSNVSFKNPHYLGAAGMMYAKLAFIDFTDRATPSSSTSTLTYGQSLTATDDGGKLGSTHRILGTPAMATDSHVGGRVLVSGGPCVTCHMSTVKDHTWKINANAFNQVCVKCHTAEGTTTLTADNFKTLFLEEQAVPFQDTIALAVAKLKQNFNISYSDTYPYFFDDSLTPATAVKDWTRATFLGTAMSAADAKKLMGACLNIKLMKADPAAYVHSRSYARRVLYDTIDWLDDRTINMSAGATAIAWDSVKFGKGAKAYTDGTLTTLDAGTTADMVYLLGWSRSTGAWNGVERP